MKTYAFYLFTSACLLLLGGCGSSKTDDSATVKLSALHFEQSSYTASIGSTVSPVLFYRIQGTTKEVIYTANSSLNLKLKWTTDDPQVATVNAAGVVTCVNYGETTLRLTSTLYNGEATATISIPQPSGTAVGQWMLTTWNGTDELSEKVYLALNSDQSFGLYQQINTQGFSSFGGTYQLSENILSGTYTDQTAWSQSYTISVVEPNMTLTGKSDQSVAVYTRTTIPDYVKEGTTAQPTSRTPEKRWL